MSPSSLPTVIGTLFFVFTFFSFGEAAFEGHVNYPAWLRITDRASFEAYHSALSARIGVLIVPLVLSTILNAALLWRRPRAIPAWSVWVTLALMVGIWISTVTIQIPIQMQLAAEGYSLERLERLIATDLLYRKLPGYVRLLITSWMLYRVIRAADESSR